MKRKKRSEEAVITNGIRQFLKMLNIFHWKQWQGPMSQPRGVSDILGIYNGQMLAIEVKKPGGKLSEYQEQFIKTVNKNGGIAFMATSIDDVIEKLGLEDRFLFK